jgi:hypothetical protein
MNSANLGRATAMLSCVLLLCRTTAYAAAFDDAPDGQALQFKRVTINASGAHEDCFRLEPGDVVDYQFDSSRAVSFNIHYHEADKVLEPVRLANSLHADGSYKAAVAQGYCMMWENSGKAEAKLDYGFRIRGRSIDTIR